MELRRTFDTKADAQRRQVAGRGRVMLEAVWSKSGAGANAKNGGLRGPYGDLLRNYIETLYAGGPVPDINGAKGYPYRHALLCALVTADFNPLHMLADRLGVLYRQAVKIEGVEGPAWDWLRGILGFEGVSQARQRATIAIGSCAIRPSLTYAREGVAYPVGLAVVTPDRAFAIADPSNPAHAVVFGEMIEKGRWQIWDVVDPEMPVWGEWRSIDEWKMGRRPVWSVAGPAYWWRLEGLPVVPAVCHQFRATPGELLPVHPTEIEGALELISEATFARYVGRAGAFETTYILSEGRLEGLDNITADPAPVRALSGAGQKQIFTAGSSVAAGEMLDAKLQGQLQRWAQRFDAGLEASQSESAKSGYAIELEMTGERQLFQSTSTRTAPLDRHLIQIVAAQHNALVRAGQMPLTSAGGQIGYAPMGGEPPTTAHLIDARDCRVTYPEYMSSRERAARRADLAEAVENHQESPQALWLFDRDRENDGPDGPNWAEATESILRACSDAVAFAAQGYGQDWGSLAVLGQALPGDDAAQWVPSAPTATTAAKGLNLRDAFRGRALTGLDPQTRRLIRRAKALANQVPQTMGEARVLLGWLEAHEGDRSLDSAVGSWGDDSDPSGEYITWLSQGGDEALSELRALLRGTDAPESV